MQENWYEYCSRRLHKIIQAPDVSCNKPVKAVTVEKYDIWLAEGGTDQETPAENLKPLLRHFVVNWMMKAWKEITSSVIKKSFKMCAFNLSTDALKDDLIHISKSTSPANPQKKYLHPSCSYRWWKNRQG